ncbi:hypothetical protein [Phenylobacterium immobile]|uniref:hypothetical protein n=1 Tax=Phenylobacterium immobile TaxID=21 RepID=UPI00159ECDB6|nr:hypothetical protein [Phenylobacterium immobile]
MAALAIGGFINDVRFALVPAFCQPSAQGFRLQRERLLGPVPGLPTPPLLPDFGDYGGIDTSALVAADNWSMADPAYLVAEDVRRIDVAALVQSDRAAMVDPAPAFGGDLCEANS